MRVSYFIRKLLSLEPQARPG